MKENNEKNEGLWWDKHGSCVQPNVCVQEGEWEQNREWGIENAGGGVPAQSLMPPALCTVLIHPSLASSNHREAFLHAGAPSSMGPPHGHVKCQAHLHESTKRAVKTNMGVTQEIQIRICSFTQQHKECPEIHATSKRPIQKYGIYMEIGKQAKMSKNSPLLLQSALYSEGHIQYIIMPVSRDQG